MSSEVGVTDRLPEEVVRKVRKGSFIFIAIQIAIQQVATVRLLENTCWLPCHFQGLKQRMKEATHTCTHICTRTHTYTHTHTHPKHTHTHTQTANAFSSFSIPTGVLKFLTSSPQNAFEGWPLSCTTPSHQWLSWLWEGRPLNLHTHIAHKPCLLLFSSGEGCLVIVFFRGGLSTHPAYTHSSQALFVIVFFRGGLSTHPAYTHSSQALFVIVFFRGGLSTHPAYTHSSWALFVCCLVCFSPWYNCTGWLGLKHQVIYLKQALNDWTHYPEVGIER